MATWKTSKSILRFRRWGVVHNMEKEIDKNSKENKGKVTKKVCKTIDNKMIKFYTTMQQRWKKYIDKISGQGEA